MSPLDAASLTVRTAKKVVCRGRLSKIRSRFDSTDVLALVKAKETHRRTQCLDRCPPPLNIRSSIGILLRYK